AESLGQADPVQDPLGVGRAHALEGVRAQALEGVRVVERVVLDRRSLELGRLLVASPAQRDSLGWETKCSMSNFEAVSRKASSSRSARRRKASAAWGSDCVPRKRWISSITRGNGSALRYGRSEVIASTVSATRMMRLG